MFDQKMIDRFWAKVDKSEECWEWMGACRNFGYGNFWASGKWYGAHIFSWIVNFGKIKNDLCVLHECDNPKCVNPKHLWLGTKRDNIYDSINKNRSPQLTREFRLGEKNQNSKLCRNDVLKIRKMFENGSTYSEIKNFFPVSVSTIYNIKSKKTWNHI
jgi:hypothetical protein